MRTRRAAWAAMIAIFTAGAVTSVTARAGGKKAATACRATPITLSEAETLIYIMPVSQQIRTRGQDVTWLVDSQAVSMAKYDGADYYIFYVTFTGPTEGSPTLGYYAVNKHTADVLDLVGQHPQIVTSEELDGVQRIMRRAHCIDAPTIKGYRFRNPEAGGAPLSPKDLCGRGCSWREAVPVRPAGKNRRR